MPGVGGRLPWYADVVCLNQAIGDLDAERRQAWDEFLTSYRAKLKEEGMSNSERQAGMNAINPLYIPRNQVLQEVIKSAEAGNYGPVRHLPDMRLVSNRLLDC